MKKFFVPVLSVFFLFFSGPVMAEQYRISVLQVSDVTVFDNAYQGFVDTLARNGMVEGDNLILTRHVIDADLEAGLWEKMGILLKIKNTASKIVAENPDLVLTIGTPATRYSRGKFVSAGIPVVFTSVANPVAAGCESMTRGGKGITGATIYIDPGDVMKIVRLALPGMKTMGIIHCDDDNAVASAHEIRDKAANQGVRVLTKQVSKSDKIAPAALALIDEGVDAFGIPPDSYYALRDNEPSRDLLAVIREKKIPAIAFMTSGARGCILYIGPSLKINGGLSAEQAVKILKEGASPGDLPVARQQDLTILSDTAAIRHLGLSIPLEVLQLAKPFSESY